jgi:hypothetical protein
VLKEHDAGWAIIDTGETRDRIVVLCGKDAESEATLALLNRPVNATHPEAI